MSDEEEGEENGSNAEAKTDFFVPRRSVKKLQLKAVSLDTSSVGDEGFKLNETEATKSNPMASTSTEELTPVAEGRPDIRNREDLDDSIALLKSRRPAVAFGGFLNQSVQLERSVFLDETGVGDGDGEVTGAEEISDNIESEAVPPHPAGIVLRRCGYTTIPTMEELAIKGLDDDGKCIVSSFSIIRRDYGQIFFEGPIDVANLNLDEIGIN